MLVVIRHVSCIINIQFLKQSTGLILTNYIYNIPTTILIISENVRLGYFRSNSYVTRFLFRKAP